MKLHLPKQLFTALLAAITLATPSAWGESLYVEKGGDFWGGSHSFVFTLNPDLLSDNNPDLLAAYWNSAYATNTDQDYAANAYQIKFDGTKYTFTAGRGRLSSTTLDDSATLTSKTDAYESTTSTALTAGHRYLVQVSGGDQNQVVTLVDLDEDSSATPVSLTYYKGNMNGGNNSIQSTSTSQAGYGVSAVYVWNATGSDSANFTGSNFWATPTSITDKNVLFAASNTSTTYASTVNVTSATSVANMDVYGSYIFTDGSTDATGSLTVTGNLNIAADARATFNVATTLGGTVTNNGSITLNGALVIENLDADHFDVADVTFYSSATNQTTDPETLSGYASTKYQIISGTVTLGENFSYNGTYEFDEDKGLFVAGSIADTTRFYVNENIKWGVAGSEGDNFTETRYTDRTASIYVVGADKTLDLNFGSTNSTHGWDGKSFELHEGAILANSGAEGNTSWQQLYRIDLKGNAKIDASTHAYGFQASGRGKSILNLNNYTLEKTGDAAFRMINTSINAGTIKITSGAVQIGAWLAESYDVIATEVDFVLDGGNLTFYDNGNALTAKSISGSGNINSLDSQKGELTLAGNSGTHTITGDIGLNKLNLNGSNSYTLNGSMAIGEQLNVSNGKLQVNGSMLLGNTAAINLAKDAELKKDNMAIIGTGNYSSVTRLSSGGSDTFAYDSDSHEVTNARIEMTKTEDAELKLKLTGTEVTNAGSGTLKVLNSANTITNLAAESGNVELNATMRVDGISAKRDRVVSIAAEKTLNMGEGSKVQLSGTDSTAVASMTAKTDLAMARLQADASFTIQDMTLTNTTITAASTETRVNLSNVSGEATLAMGAFTTDATAQAQVAPGGDESGVDYSVTSSVLSGITLDNTQATIAVDLGDLSSAGEKIDKGIYSFAITLDGFHLLDGETQAGVLFTADSWLGQLLTAQRATTYVSGAVETPASLGEGGTGGVSVSYSTSNVGTVIIITGLNVPEPTTATLSLLALAALAARRRRND